MKHRARLFAGLLVGALVIVYTQPIVYPMFASKSTIRHAQPKAPAKKQTNLSYETLKTEGFASYINHSFDKFIAEYGNPTESFPSGYSYLIHKYYVNKKDGYIEVSTEANKIIGIKVLGNEKKNISPFSIGMDMKQLSTVMMVYPNFTIRYENEEINMELSEEDMNYRPLVAFDNDTFAILFFDQANTRLNSIMYLNKELLLKLSPYMMSGDTIPRFVKEENANWDEINSHKEEAVQSLFKLLRKNDRLPAYQPSLELKIYGHTLLNLFAEHASDYLTTQRAQQLQRIQLNQSNDEFIFTDDELKNLTSSQNMLPIRGHFELPVYDPTFTILSSYSNSFIHAKFLDKKDKKIAIAFSKENMIVLLQEGQTTEKDSDD